MTIISEQSPHKTCVHKETHLKVLQYKYYGVRLIQTANNVHTCMFQCGGSPAL